jgi:hypothetical protein
VRKREIKFDGEKGTLVTRNPIPDPPLHEVRKQIRMEIGAMIRSHRELDGTIKSDTEIYEIACLMKALELLPKSAREITERTKPKR